MTIFNAIGNNAQQKKEREQRERSRPGTGPPTNRPSSEQGSNDREGGLFGELRKQFEDVMNDNEEHPTQRAPRAESEVYRDEKTETSDGRREYERERERLRRESREAKRRLENTETPPMTVDKKNRPRQSVPFGDLSGNNVVKGVIWSEVLGEPKSKRPHKTNRMIR